MLLRRNLPGRINEFHNVSIEGAVDRVHDRQLAQRLHDHQQHDSDDDETEHL